MSSVPAGKGSLWIRLSRDLRRRLDAGEFTGGFPTDKRLCKEYGVSRHTVRAAVAELTGAGLVERRRALGSVVAEAWEDEPLRDRYVLTRTVPGGEVLRTNDVLRCRARPATRRAVERLGVAHGEPVVEVRRRRLYGGVPLAVHTSLLPMQFAAGLLDADLADRSFYRSLAKYCSIRVTAGEETVTPVTLTKSQAAALDEAAGATAFRAERIAFAGTTPIEYRISLLRADMYRFVGTWGANDPPASRP